MTVVRVESHGFGELAAALRQAGLDITEEVAKVTGKACNNMKKDAQRIVRGHVHLPHLASSYTYEVRTSGTRVSGEVGAEHARFQGKLDVYIENGTPTSAPIVHWAPAADREVPRWADYCDLAAVAAFEGSGA